MVNECSLCITTVVPLLRLLLLISVSLHICMSHVPTEERGQASMAPTTIPRCSPTLLLSRETGSLPRSKSGRTK
jgi:hypothetical protein